MARRLLHRYMRSIQAIFTNPAMGVMATVGGIFLLCIPVLVWCAFTGQDFLAFAEKALHTATGITVLVILAPLLGSLLHS